MKENGQATEPVAGTEIPPVNETQTEPTQVLEGTEGTQPDAPTDTVTQPELQSTPEPTPAPDANKTEEQLPPAPTPNEVDKKEPAPEEELSEEEQNQLIESAIIDKSAVANFIVDAIEGNGAHEKSKEGCTLRLVPIETTETKSFFKSFPPVLHIGVVNPEVAAKFKVGGKVSLILLNEE